MASGDKDWGDDSAIGWSRWAIASAVLLAIVVLAGIWVVATGDDGDGGGGGGGEASPTTDRTESTTSTTTGESTSCPKAKESTAKALDGPVNMITYEGLQLPQAEAGPKEIDPDSGLARCYDRSPTGAVMAAANFAGRAFASPSREQIVARQMSPGAVRSKALREVGRMSPTARVETCPVAGFAVRSFEPMRAVVRLAFRCEDGELRQDQIVLVWHAGDWLVDGTVEPAELPPPGSLNGFQRWEGA